MKTTCRRTPQKFRIAIYDLLMFAVPECPLGQWRAGALWVSGRSRVSTPAGAHMTEEAASTPGSPDKRICRRVFMG